MVFVSLYYAICIVLFFCFLLFVRKIAILSIYMEIGMYILTTSPNKCYNKQN